MAGGERTTRTARSPALFILAISPSSQLRAKADLDLIFLFGHSLPSLSKTLREGKNGQKYISSLGYVDRFFSGRFAIRIDDDLVKEFKLERKRAGAANVSINRSLSLLRRMFNLAVENKKFTAERIPTFKMFPEPDARTGFLDYADFAQLRQALPERLRPEGFRLRPPFGTSGRLPVARGQVVDQTRNTAREGAHGGALPTFRGRPDRGASARAATHNQNFTLPGTPVAHRSGALDDASGGRLLRDHLGLRRGRRQSVAELRFDESPQHRPAKERGQNSECSQHLRFRHFRLLPWNLEKLGYGCGLDYSLRC
jgi:hypothetical protein